MVSTCARILKYSRNEEFSYCKIFSKGINHNNNLLQDCESKFWLFFYESIILKYCVVLLCIANVFIRVYYSAAETNIGRGLILL